MADGFDINPRTNVYNEEGLVVGYVDWLVDHQKYQAYVPDDSDHRLSRYYRYFKKGEKGEAIGWVLGRWDGLQ